MTKRKYDATDHAIAVLKLKLDYHLMCLHDAIQNGDITQQEIEKRKLEKIRTSLEHLDYFVPVTR